MDDSRLVNPYLGKSSQLIHEVCVQFLSHQICSPVNRIPSDLHSVDQYHGLSIDLETVG